MKAVRLRIAVLMGVALSLPGCPLVPAVAGFPGPLEFVHLEMTYAEILPLSVFIPEGDAPEGGWPLVVVNPGWNQSRGAYFKYAEQLAQWGYVAVIRFYPDPAWADVGISTFDEQIGQVSDVIDWCAEQHTNPDSPLFGKVNTSSVGAMGHSLGSTLSMVTAVLDERITASVQLDGWFSGGSYPLETEIPGSGVALMWISSAGTLCGGHPPDAVLPADIFPLIEVADVPAIEVIVDGAAHIDFLESSEGINALGQIICGGGTRDKNEVRAIATRYLISWFNVHLKGLTEFEDNYNGVSSAQDVADGIVTIVAKL